MTRSAAVSVEEYLAELPPDRAAVISDVRELVLDNLPDGIEESMNFGMIADAIGAVTVEGFIDLYESARQR